MRRAHTAVVVIPIRSDVPSRSAPIAVVALVATNIGVLIYQIALALGASGDPRASAEFVDLWGLVPREFLRGLSDSSATRQIAWLTPFTSMFLHSGLVHLLGNLLYLWIFGRNVEDLIGHGRFLVFYLVCGLAAAAVHVASDPASYAATIGSSGAISGVLGGYLVSYPTGRVRLLWPRLRVPALVFLLAWVALQVVYGLDPGAGGDRTAWWAHVGGFVAGAALARSMWVRKPTRSRLRI